jgi:hypothetical protein
VAGFCASDVESSGLLSYLHITSEYIRFRPVNETFACSLRKQAFKFRETNFMFLFCFFFRQ